MLRKLLTTTLVFLACIACQSQCPVQSDLWSRLNYLAANSSDLTPAQINTQLQELKTFETLIVACNYRNDSTHALLLQRIGVMYFKQNNFWEAIKYTNQSIDLITSNIYRPSVRKSALVKNYYNLSLYYGQLKKARERFAAIDSCIAVASRFDIPDYYYLYSLSEKIEHLFNIGEYERCYEFAQTGETSIAKYLKGADSINMVVNFLALKVNVLFQFRDYDSASHLLNNKLKDLRKLGASVHYGPIYSLLAQLFINKGETAKAEEYYQLAVKYNLSSGFNLGAMQALNNLAYNIYFKALHDYPKAIDIFRQALALRNNDRTYEESQRLESLNLLCNIASAHLERNKFDSASTYFQLAFNEIRPGIDENGIRDGLESFVLNKRTNFVTELVIEKANAFRKKYRIEKNPGDLKQALKIYAIADQLMSRLRKEQSEIQSKLFWRQQSRKLYEGAIDASFLANEGTSGFYFFEKSRAVLLQDQLLEQNNQVYYQNFLDTSFITIHELYKKTLKNNQALLELFNGDSAIYTLMIRDGKVRMAKIEKAVFDNISTEYLRYLGDAALMNQHYPEFVEVSRKLFNLIFDGGYKLPDRLIVSPDSRYIPFEALITGNGMGADSYLLAYTAVSYTYSARFLTTSFLSEDAGDAKDFLGIAPVDFPSGKQLASLTGSRESLEKISRLFRKSDLEISKGATKKSFVENYYKYRIIQLYSHASDNSAGGEPVIYFADSSLFLNDLIASHIPKTRLIVLSACKTGSGKWHEGEGVFSFNRQFAALGIPSSVINLWSVENQSTYKITELFYEFLAKGITADVALQKAKLAFIRSAPMEKQLPCYWAAAVLAGKSDAIIVEGKSAWVYVLEVAVILFLILLAYFFFRKRQATV
ncbi:MAG: CHAT domain-containing tetratricopeptide repeat protein [Chitinophagaceae bacterium]